MIMRIVSEFIREKDDQIYGYHIKRDVAESLESERRNVQYQNLVWGAVDNADNVFLNIDEQQVIMELLDAQPNAHALEVGCGSGRLTLEIARKCRKLTAIDQTPAICERARSNLMRANVMNCEVSCADFLDFDEGNFDVAFLLENLIGMNLMPSRRMKIFQKVESALKPGGVAVFGFRVVSYVPQGEIWYQAMPWRSAQEPPASEPIFGVAANWSVGGFLREVRESGANLQVQKVFAGKARPAGGKSYFAILQREGK